MIHGTTNIKYFESCCISWCVSEILSTLHLLSVPFGRKNCFSAIYISYIQRRYCSLFCLKHKETNLKQKTSSSVINAVSDLYSVQISVLCCSSVLLHNQCPSSCTPLPLLLDTDENCCTHNHSYNQLHTLQGQHKAGNGKHIKQRDKRKCLPPMQLSLQQTRSFANRETKA